MGTRIDPELLDEVRRRAADISRVTGGIEYLKDTARTVSKGLIARETLPDVMVREHGELRAYRPRVVTPKPGARRTVDRVALRRRFPHAYRAAVTETPADKPYQVRLEGSRVGVKAAEWAELRSAGAEVQRAFMEERYRGHEWDVRTQLESVRLMRQRAESLHSNSEALRNALMLYVCEKELPLSIQGAGDGVIRLRDTKPTITVDYDLLEKEYPGAALLIKRTPTSTSPRLVFSDPADEEYDPEGDRNPFEGD